MTRPSVDLPEPDSPMMPNVSRGCTANDTPSTARTGSRLPCTGNSTDASFTSMRGWLCIVPLSGDRSGQMQRVVPVAADDAASGHGQQDLRQTTGIDGMGA